MTTPQAGAVAGAMPMRGGRRLFAGLLLFGLAFGFVEAAVVVDLRATYEPLQRRLHPETPPGELFPLLRLDELRGASPEAWRLLRIEVAREAATIVMLAGVGLCAGGSWPRSFAAFLVGFGLWDLCYYAALALLTGWPGSVWSWDLLFLIPVPWAGPVLAPVVVSLVMVTCGAHAIARDFGPRPLEPTWRAWSGVSAGGLMAVSAFCWDFRHLMDGGRPRGFPWGLFAAGVAVALASYLITASARKRGDPRRADRGTGVGRPASVTRTM